MGKPEDFDLERFAMQERQYGRRMAAKAAAANANLAYVIKDKRELWRKTHEQRLRIEQLEGQLKLTQIQMQERLARPLAEIPKTGHYERVAATLGEVALRDMTAEQMDLALVLQGYRNMQRRIEHLEALLSRLVQDARGLLSVFRKDARI